MRFLLMILLGLFLTVGCKPTTAIDTDGETSVIGTGSNTIGVRLEIKVDPSAMCNGDEKAD